MKKPPQLNAVCLNFQLLAEARLAQSVEHKALNLVVLGSSPTVGVAAEPTQVMTLHCALYKASGTTRRTTENRLRRKRPKQQRRKEQSEGNRKRRAAEKKEQKNGKFHVKCQTYKREADNTSFSCGVRSHDMYGSHPLSCPRAGSGWALCLSTSSFAVATHLKPHLFLDSRGSVSRQVPNLQKTSGQHFFFMWRSGP